MPIVASRSNASAFGYGWSAGAPEVLGGMVLITPTSVDKAGAGSTATIVSSGSVEFSACTSLSLNGVFSATYDNYMIVMRGTGSAETWYGRLRSAGTDNSTASSYTYQSIGADNTTISASRTSTDNFAGILIDYTTVDQNGSIFYLYGPFLAQPTAGRTTTALSSSSAYLVDRAYTHNQSTSYDGLTILTLSLGTSGSVSVYGLVGA